MTEGVGGWVRTRTDNGKGKSEMRGSLHSGFAFGRDDGKCYLCASVGMTV